MGISEDAKTLSLHAFSLSLHGLRPSLHAFSLSFVSGSVLVIFEGFRKDFGRISDQILIFSALFEFA